MRCVFFLEGARVPASRVRVIQYKKILKEKQISYKFLSTIPSKYLYAPKWIKSIFPLYIAGCVGQLIFIFLQRIVQIILYVPNSDVIFFQRDLLYRVNYPILERLIFLLAKSKTRFILDIDDAIFLDPKVDKKLKNIIKNIDVVIVGNHFLAQYFALIVPSVIVPTTLDMEKFNRIPKKAEKKIVLGWTGLRSNLRYLEDLKDVLTELQNKYDLSIHIISETSEPVESLKGLSINYVKWNESEEVSQLSQLDIGIMPLSNNLWSQGKCGFKLLQYMALGIASVASPVGVNSEIVKDGINGFLAATHQDWLDVLSRLISDPALRVKVGNEGVKSVESCYSMQNWEDFWVETVAPKTVDNEIAQ